MYKYVGPGTRAAKGSDLDQVLSCLTRQLERRSTSRRAVSWTCLPLLDSPDTAGVGVGRGHVASLRGVLVLLFESIYHTANFMHRYKSFCQLIIKNNAW